ncbi:MAG: threonine aldolase family protein [Oscillospiraceae bacterium]
MKFIDLRSDTVTQPTEAMRRAMYEAAVGDDVYEDDPTVNELQEVAAHLLGKEATMGNQLAVMTHTLRADEIILSAESHIAVNEGGGLGALSGVVSRQLTFPGHLPSAAMIEKAIRAPGNVHSPRTGLIALENPLSQGIVVPLETMREIDEVAHRHGVPVHLDGARLFHAATVLGCEVREITQYCDSVMTCLSKGLCAPIGSMLAGSREFIDLAKRNRKILGGGLRQAGVLAAPGLIALREMTGRLAEDHATAAHLAARLDAMDGVTVDFSKRDINMVFVTIDRPQAWLDALPGKLLERGVKIGGYKDSGLRFVTSHEVTLAQIDTACDLLQALLA